MIPLFARRFARIVDRATKSEPLNHERGSTPISPRNFRNPFVDSRIELTFSSPLPNSSPNTLLYEVKDIIPHTLSFVRQLGGRREGTTTPKLSLGGNPVKEVEPESKVPEAV